MKAKLLIAAVLIIMMITACTPTAATPAATEVPTIAPPTATETLPPTLTFTPLPTATDTPTPFPTMTPTVTLTPTPVVDYSAVKATSMGWTGSDAMWVMFVAPGLKEGYSVKINNVAYSCTPTPKVADSLVCSGARKQYGEYVKIEFFGQQSQEVAYTLQTYLPFQPMPTATPVGDPRTWCPLRGTNVTCESEHRWEPDGSPCEVTSCFDACGYYYSIHTCSDFATFVRP